MISEVKRLGRWSVSAPLYLTNSAAGFALSDVGSSDKAVWFRITSNVTSQIGRYNAKAFVGSVNTAASGDLVESNLGSVPAGDDSIVWHIPEINLSSVQNVLRVGAHYLGRLAGVTSAGKKIIIFGVLPIGKTGSETTFTSSGASADTTHDWKRATHGTPLSINYVTRVYYDTSTHKLMYMYRTLTFDACGLLVEDSVEGSVDVETAVTCT